MVHIFRVYVIISACGSFKLVVQHVAVYLSVTYFMHDKAEGPKTVFD